eukprot:12754754-Alexandrium_andersonii.AAC.1
MPPRVLSDRRGLGGAPASSPVLAAPAAGRVLLPVAEGGPVLRRLCRYRLRWLRDRSPLDVRRSGYVGAPHDQAL